MDLTQPEIPENRENSQIADETQTPAPDSSESCIPELSEAQEAADDSKKAKKKGKREKSEKTKVSMRQTLRALAFFLIKMLVIVLVLWLALTYVFGVYRLSGANMYPALRDGDLCITYRLEDYYTTEVVAYRVDGEIRFGRIVAKSGDTVDGDSTGILVNGGHPSEEIFFSTQMLGTNLELPIRLNKGELLILNDYREDLNDSRTYGVINVEDLEGKVIFIFRRRGI